MKTLGYSKLYFKRSRVTTFKTSFYLNFFVCLNPTCCLFLDKDVPIDEGEYEYEQTVARFLPTNPQERSVSYDQSGRGGNKTKVKSECKQQ